MTDFLNLVVEYYWLIVGISYFVYWVCEVILIKYFYAPKSYTVLDFLQMAGIFAAASLLGIVNIILIPFILIASIMDNTALRTPRININIMKFFNKEIIKIK